MKDKTTAISLIISTVLAVAGLILSIKASKETKENQVQIGSIITNTSSPQCENRWEPWINRITNRTTYLGIKKRVLFQDKFNNAPSIVASFKLINVQTIDQAFSDTLFKTLTFDERMRCRMFHVLLSTGEADEAGFTIYAGIGIPAPAADILTKYFRDNKPLKSTIDDEFGFKSLCKYDPQDDWMLKYYEIIGTLEISWVATANK